MSSQAIYAHYGRTSREFKNHQKVSIEQQLSDAKAKAKELGGNIPDDLIFIDADWSSKIPPRHFNPSARKVRPELTRLLDLIQTRKIAGVIVRKRDRLSRPLEQTLWLYRFLNENNCPIIATHEAAFSNDAAGRYSMKQMALNAEYQLESTTENIQAAKTFCKKEGRKLCGATLPGYQDGEQGKVIVHEADLAVMTEAFQRIAKGENLASVCRWLNADHRDILTRIRNGRMFYLESVKRWLTNTKYVGLLADGTPDKIYPATINPDLFYRVQEILKRRQVNKTRWKIERHVLSGLIKCGCCGNKLSVLSAKLKNKWQKVYACRYLALEHDYWPVMIQEAEWIRFVETVFMQPKDQAWEFLKTDRKPSDNPERSSLKVQLSNLDDQLDKMAKLLGSGKLTVEAFTAGSNRLNETKTRLQAKLKATPEQSGNTVLKPWGKCTHDEKQQLIGETIQEIRAFNRHVDVVLKRCVLRFPLMRQAGKIGRGINTLLPRDVGNIDDILLVLDGQLLKSKVATMDWTGWIKAKDFYPAPPAIAKRKGESRQDYHARYERERRAVA